MRKFRDDDPRQAALKEELTDVLTRKGKTPEDVLDRFTDFCSLINLPEDPKRPSSTSRRYDLMLRLEITRQFTLANNGAGDKCQPC